MFVSKREYFEEVSVVLQEGKDFTQEDLEPNKLSGGQLKDLSTVARSKIAYNLKYLTMYWSGFYDPETKTVRCTLRKPIYIDENGEVVRV